MKRVLMALLTMCLALGVQAAPPVKTETKVQNLLVEVEQTTERKRSWLDNISIGIGIGGGWGGSSSVGGGVGVGVPVGGGGSGGERTVSSLRVLSGGNAYIQTGNSKPLPWAAVQPDGTVIRADAEQSTVSGIYVSPRLQGDQVLIELAATQQGVSGNQINNSTLATTVSGPAGEWLAVGGVVKDSDGQERVLMGPVTAQQSLKSMIRVRVSILP